MVHDVANYQEDNHAVGLDLDLTLSLSLSLTCTLCVLLRSFFAALSH